MDSMTAYCGLACDTCPIHLATLEQDKSKQLSMRAEIAKICTEQYGMSIQIHDITDCDGCRAGGRLFSGCAKCEIRKCAMERAFESCAFCEEYVCDKLLKHFESDPSARTRLEEFRRSQR
jgi:hypothetical protein